MVISFTADDFSFGMINLVHACIDCVRSINTCANTVVQHSADESDRPLRTVKTHNGYCGSLLDLKLCHWFCKLECVGVVLVPRPCYNLTLPLNEHSIARSRSFDLVDEHFWDCLWLFRAWTALLYFDGDFGMYIGDPVESLAVDRINKGFVTLRAHNNNSIVNHGNN